MAPIAIAIAFRHAARALGARRASLEMVALTAYGFALEAVAMAVFDSHRYDASWRVLARGVPLAVAGVWAAIIVAAMAVAWRYGAVSPITRAATAALAAVALDMMIEPVATRAGLWAWTPPGPWLGVPIGNFVGWMVIVGAYAYGAERWTGETSWPQAIARRAALAAGCIVLLVAVGLVWTHLGLERAFADAGGWMVWAAVMLVTGVLSWGGTSAISHGASLPPKPPTGRRRAARAAALPIRYPLPLAPDSLTSLPALLAATAGRGPQAVLGVVALAFALPVVWIAEGGVTVAVVGSLAALGIVAARQPPA